MFGSRREQTPGNREGALQLPLKYCGTNRGQAKVDLPGVNGQETTIMREHYETRLLRESDWVLGST